MDEDEESFSEHNASSLVEETTFLSSQPDMKAPQNPTPQSLITLSATSFGRNLPFDFIYSHRTVVPDHLQMEILKRSFPPSEKYIRLYSFLNEGSNSRLKCGRQIVESNGVINCIQIGSYLSATVRRGVRRGVEFHRASVTFDRCSITRCWCTCMKELRAVPVRGDDTEMEPSIPRFVDENVWCVHVIATCLHRIRSPQDFLYRLPIGQSLINLSKSQLLEFSYRLLCQYEARALLPCAQSILDSYLADDHRFDLPTREEVDLTAGNPEGLPPRPPLTLNAIRRVLREQLKGLVTPRATGLMEPETLISEMENSELTELALSRGQGAVAEDYSAASVRQQILLSLRAFNPAAIWHLLCNTAHMHCRGDPNALPILTEVTEALIENKDVMLLWFLTQTNVERITKRCVAFKSNRHACTWLCEALVDLWRVVCLDPRVFPLEDADDGRDRRLRLATMQRFQETAIRAAREALTTFRIGAEETANLFVDKKLELFRGFKPAIETCRLSLPPLCSLPSIETKEEFHAAMPNFEGAFVVGTSEGTAMWKDFYTSLSSPLVRQNYPPLRSRFGVHFALCQGYICAGRRTEALALVRRLAMDMLTDAPCLIECASRAALLNLEVGSGLENLRRHKVVVRQKEPSRGALVGGAGVESSGATRRRKSRLNAGRRRSALKGKLKVLQKSIVGKMSIVLTEWMYCVEFLMDCLYHLHSSHGPHDPLEVYPPGLANYKLAGLIKADPLAKEGAYRPAIVAELEELRHDGSSFFNLDVELAFRLGLLTLALPRGQHFQPMAEVLHFNHEFMIAARLFRLPVHSSCPHVLADVRREAQLRINDQRFGDVAEAYTPYVLVEFLYTQLVGDVLPPLWHHIGLEPGIDDARLAFELALSALGRRSLIPATLAPLLYECQRYARERLFCILLDRVKSRPEKLSRLLDAFLDRSLNRAYRCPSLHQCLSLAKEELFDNYLQLKGATGEERAAAAAAAPVPSDSVHSEMTGYGVIWWSRSTTPSEAGEVEEGPHLLTDGVTGSDFNSTAASSLPGGDAEPVPSTSYHQGNIEATDSEGWAKKLRCTKLRDPRKPVRHSVGMAAVDSSAPETTSSDNSPTIRRSLFPFRPPPPPSPSLQETSGSLSKPSFPADEFSDEGGESSGDSSISVGLSTELEKYEWEGPSTWPPQVPPLKARKLPKLYIRSGYAELLFDLAKKIRVMAGGINADATVFDANTLLNTRPLIRELRLASFLIGLYAMALQVQVLEDKTSPILFRYRNWISVQLEDIGLRSKVILLYIWRDVYPTDALINIASELLREVTPFHRRVAAEMLVSAVPDALSSPNFDAFGQILSILYNTRRGNAFPEIYEKALEEADREIAARGTALAACPQLQRSMAKAWFQLYRHYLPVNERDLTARDVFDDEPRPPEPLQEEGKQEAAEPRGLRVPSPQPDTVYFFSHPVYTIRYDPQVLPDTTYPPLPPFLVMNSWPSQPNPVRRNVFPEELPKRANLRDLESYIRRAMHRLESAPRTSADIDMETYRKGRLALLKSFRALILSIRHMFPKPLPQMGSASSESQAPLRIPPCHAFGHQHNHIYPSDNISSLIESQQQARTRSEVCCALPKTHEFVMFGTEIVSHLQHREALALYCRFVIERVHCPIIVASVTYALLQKYYPKRLACAIQHVGRFLWLDEKRLPEAPEQQFQLLTLTASDNPAEPAMLAPILTPTSPVPPELAQGVASQWQLDLEMAWIKRLAGGDFFGAPGWILYERMVNEMHYLFQVQISLLQQQQSSGRDTRELVDMVVSAYLAQLLMPPSHPAVCWAALLRRLRERSSLYALVMEALDKLGQANLNFPPLGGLAGGTWHIAASNLRALSPFTYHLGPSG